ncbi:MAG: hypothetical protein ACLFR2_00820 [Candidatus Kapaibacterium sp.]
MDKGQLKELLDQIEVNDVFELPYFSKQEIETILESFIEIENDTAQKCRYIHILANTTGDFQRAGVLFEKAIKFALPGEQYLIAERVAETLNDREWAENICRGALAELNSADPLSKLAVSASKYIDNEELIKNIFEKALRLASDSEDFSALISACSRQARLAEYHSRVLEELLSASTGAKHYILLANEYSMLKDSTRAEHYFRVALGLAKKDLNFTTIISLFNKSRCHFSGDKPQSNSFMADCAAVAFDAAGDADQYAELADSLSTLFPNMLETKLTGRNSEKLNILSTREAAIDRPRPPYILINDSAWYSALISKGLGEERFTKADATLYRILGKTLAKLIKKSQS